MSEDTEHNDELADMPSFDDAPETVLEAAPIAAAKPAAQAKPEKGQAVGAKAKPTAKDRVAGQVVKRGEKPPERAPQAGGVELVRITKTGHGQVHDGEGGTYDWGAEVHLETANALALEKISYAEII